MISRLRRSLFSSGPLISSEEDSISDLSEPLPEENTKFRDFPAPAFYEFINDAVTHSSAEIDSRRIGKISRGTKMEIIETQICEGHLRGRLAGWAWVTLMDLEYGIANARQVVKEGPIRIRKGFLNQYKARWFVLHNDFTLRYYKPGTRGDASAEPRVISLHNVRCSPCDKDERAFTLTTELNGQVSKYVLQTTSVHERRYWMQLINDSNKDSCCPVDQLLTDLYDAGSFVEKSL